MMVRSRIASVAASDSRMGMHSDCQILNGVELSMLTRPCPSLGYITQPHALFTANSRLSPPRHSPWWYVRVAEPQRSCRKRSRNPELHRGLVPVRSWATFPVAQLDELDCRDSGSRPQTAKTTLAHPSLCVVRDSPSRTVTTHPRPMRNGRCWLASAWKLSNRRAQAGGRLTTGR